MNCENHFSIYTIAKTRASRYDTQKSVKYRKIIWRLLFWSSLGINKYHIPMLIQIIKKIVQWLVKSKRTNTKPYYFIKQDYGGKYHLRNSFSENLLVLVLGYFLSVECWLHHKFNLLHNSLLSLHFLQKLEIDKISYHET